MTVNYPTIGFKPPTEPPTAPPKPKDHEEPTEPAALNKPTPHQIGLSVLASIARDPNAATKHRVAAATALLGY